MDLPDARRLYALERAPDLPPRIVSLMFPKERDLLFSLAKHYYCGDGDIIDAGIFMGSSTFCFATGLNENPNTRTGTIHSYDRAIVTEGMANYQTVRDRIGAPGTDFGNYLRTTVESIGRPIVLHLGDIMQMSYSGKIEILFLDILKDRSIFRHCNRIFMGCLIGGRSLVVQQDYFWYENWYINAYMEMLSDYFLMVDSAETSCVFLNTSAVPAALYETDPLEQLSRLEIISLLDRSTARSTTIFQYVMSELCTVGYALANGGLPEADIRLAKLETRFGDLIRGWEGGNRRAWAAYKVLSMRRRNCGISQDTGRSM
jgi:hypothetical protein